MTPEQREARRQRMSELGKRVRASLSPEQRSAMVSRGNRSRYARRLAQQPECSVDGCSGTPQFPSGICRPHNQQKNKQKVKLKAQELGHE